MEGRLETAEEENLTKVVRGVHHKLQFAADMCSVQELAGDKMQGPLIEEDTFHSFQAEEPLDDSQEEVADMVVADTLSYYFNMNIVLSLRKLKIDNFHSPVGFSKKTQP
jgi:hypothetical protein